MMRVVKPFVIFVFCCSICFTGSAQTPFFKEVWLNDAGIPVNVNDMTMQTDGSLWLATDNGVYRFNGRTFTHITDKINQPATAIAIYDKELYVGYRDGTLGQVARDSVHPIDIHYKRPGAQITSITGVGSSTFWITTEDGLYLLTHQNGWRIDASHGLSDNFIYDVQVAGDKLITGTDRGVDVVGRSAGKLSVQNITTAHGLPDNIVTLIKPTGSVGQYWLGTQQGGIAGFNHLTQTVRTFKMRQPWHWGQVNDILPISRHEAWAVTDDSYLLHITATKDSMYLDTYAYEGKKIKKIIKDKAGNIWCATNKGLLMTTALYARNIKIPEDFLLSAITACTCDAYGNIWYARNKDLYTIRPDAPTPRKVASLPVPVTCLYPAVSTPRASLHQRDGGAGMWIGSFGKGLFYYSDGRLRAVNSIANLNNGHILSITATTNALWIASLNGVEETRQNSDGGLIPVRHHDKFSGIGSDYIYQLYTDHKDRVWMATDGGGVTMFDGKDFKRWDSTGGMTSQVIYAVTEDPKGHIWAVTLDKGPFWFDGNRWRQVPNLQGLQDLGISALSANASGQIIMVNQKGIDQWHPQSNQFRHYNRRLGIDIDSVSNILNCIATDTKGNVYVPFEHGFVQFRNIDPACDIKPGICITDVSLFLRPLSAGKRSFRHNENHISFQFDGINYTNPERLHYRYRLDGFDNNWINTSDENISFVQLPPGDYIFRVQASLSSYFFDANEAVYAFTIHKPFWKTWWFITASVLLSLFALYMYIRLRERSLKKTAQLQKEKMIFEYEHLKSQVNPHFLFNSLNTLLSLIEDDPHSASEYTVNLSNLYRNMLTYKGRELILLEEEYELIQAYMFVQKTRFGSALSLQTSVPGTIMKTRKIVPLALQIIIENAIKHNIVSASSPLEIHLSVQGDELVVLNRLQPKLSKDRGAGIGLMNIRKRYALLTERNISFGITGNDYIVKLPLL